MLTVGRSLSLNAESAPELPRIDALERLYRNGVKFRRGQLIQIVGRPGAGKSAFALWLAVQWNLPTLYCSADMGGFDTSVRIASMKYEMSTEAVEKALTGDPATRKDMLDGLADVDLVFSYESPITVQGLSDELYSYIDLWNDYPKLIVIDNLMDVEGCETDHGEQMKAMAEFSAISMHTGATVIVLHHALEGAYTDFARPPSRTEISNKVTQKPRLVLSVNLTPYDSAQFQVACVKQNGGKADPTGRTYATLRAQPEYNRFAAYQLTPAA